jgi:hypothetical protein
MELTQNNQTKQEITKRAEKSSSLLPKHANPTQLAHTQHSQAAQQHEFCETKTQVRCCPVEQNSSYQASSNFQLKLAERIKYSLQVKLRETSVFHGCHDYRYTCVNYFNFFLLTLVQSETLWIQICYESIQYSHLIPCCDFYSRKETLISETCSPSNHACLSVA